MPHSSLTLFCIFCFALGSHAMQPVERNPDAARIRAKIETESGEPVAGAVAEVVKWTGNWESIGANGTTDAHGIVEIDSLPTDEYLSLVVKADGFAATMQDFELAASEQRNITVQLSRPANGWIEVLTPEGDPIEGAEIQRLDFTDANGSKVAINRKTISALGGKLEQSDLNGRLNLPTLPTGASVTLWIVHPAWRVTKLEELRATSGLLTAVTLQSGVSVRIELLTDEDTRGQLEGMLADVLLFPLTGGSSNPETVNHAFPVRNGAVELTAHPANYSELRFSLQDYFLTPQLMNSPAQPFPALNLSDATESILQLSVRPRVKASGRIIDSDGKPMAGVRVIGLIENLLVDWEETGVRTFKNREWASGGDAESDEHGEYQIELTTGRAAVDIIHPGYFADPAFVEVSIASDTPNVIPIIIMRQVPTLKGKVLAVDATPVPGAIVRMRSTGYGDADPVAKTDAEGNFELQMSRIPYSRSANGLKTDVFVIAIDPVAKRSGRAAVNLKDANATSQIIVQVANQEPDWILNPLSDQESSESKPDEKEARAALSRELASRFPKGRQGNPVPSLTEGTWLNTDARSLDNFRGKYVLLDFWFVGCGPCHRDMPSVKMTHAAFSDQGFSVVSIHINTQTPENVRQFAESNNMTYPIVVDNAAGDIMKQFAEFGVSGYPTYMLIDREGKVLVNDAVPTSEELRLRRDKIEAVYHALLTNRTNLLAP